MEDVLHRMRKKEYVGENRCIPCTIVNVIAAVAFGGVVALGGAALGLGVTTSVAAGSALLVLSLVTIYLRGYLIPGTPVLTRTYLPDRLLSVFDKPEPSESPDIGVADLEDTLTRAGIVRPCDDVDDLCLTEPFGEAWRAQIETVREQATGTIDLAELLEVAPDEVHIETHDDGFVASLAGHRVGQWESEAAYIADMAAWRELRHRLDHWATLDVVEQGRLVGALRVFLETCPVCDGQLAFEDRIVESCCRSVDVLALSCEMCDARVFETRHAEGMFEEASADTRAAS